ncbi:M1 family metallopeptidase [soil metagenome]
MLALATATALTVGLVSPAGAFADSQPPSPGAAGAGDPYFPLQGNGGYDVAAYRLAIRYTPATRRLDGTAHLTARATQNLSRFDLDLRRNLVVTSVRVNGAPAAASQPANLVQELIITPRHPLPKGRTFTVEVTYGGKATPAIDPDGSLDGFIPTDDGAFVASEPQGSPTWFPVNDTPTDKATYQVAITVPVGITAVSNGALTGVSTRSGHTTWSWRLDRPVSSYLVTATLGKFNVSRGRTAGGVPYFIATDPTQQAKSAPVLAKLPRMIDYFSKVYGPYPFGQAGAIVDNAPNVGYALETATRPVFDSAPDALTLAHELAHQWYGDDVTLSRWRDIWINEGFAEFSSWLWDEHSGGTTAAQHLKDLLAIPASDPVWNPPPANPGAADQIFSDSVYERGAGTLQALRQLVGDGAFFALMRGWAASHRYANATVGDFIGYAERATHRDLRSFFANWLYRQGKPVA